MTILPLAYYQQDDVVFLSRDLLGKFLMTRIGPIVTGGMIIETEAYKGLEDKASHAYANRRTPRNEVMYAKGGLSYIYLCYGIHFMFNVVTNKAETPHAILIRAILPTVGVNEMLKRRGKTKVNRQLTSGPGSVSQALGITRAYNGLPLTGPEIWIEDRHIDISQYKVIAGPRIGVDYADEDAQLPYRFLLRL